MTMPPFDALDVVKPGLTITVSARLKNVWRLKLGLFLLGLATRVLRCPVGVERVDDDAVG